MRCSNCGKKVDDKAKFCPYCKQDLSKIRLTSNINSEKGSFGKKKNWDDKIDWS